MRLKNKGFSIIELLFVLTILSTLSVVAVVKYNKMTAGMQLEKDVMTVYKEISGVRPLSMKFDKRGKVVFSNRKMTIDKYNYIDTIRLSDWSGFAVAAGGPSKTPTGLSITSDSGAKLLWKDSMIVKKDAIGTIDTGYVLISSSKIKGITYYIGVSGGFQGIQFYKWMGNSWIKQ